MPTTIAVFNQKSGVGKTTSAVTLGAGLTHQG
jgi:cellulose biosynthesis protein BcsQ